MATLVKRKHILRGNWPVFSISAQSPMHSLTIGEYDKHLVENAVHCAGRHMNPEGPVSFDDPDLVIQAVLQGMSIGCGEEWHSVIALHSRRG